MDKKKIFGNEKNDEFEEVAEKRTSVLGYLFLLIMFGFIVGIGQTIFRDLERVFMYPVAPVGCINNFSNSEQLSNLTYFYGCSFSEIDSEFGLDEKFHKIEPEIKKIISLNEEIGNLNSKKYSLELDLNQYQEKYTVGLTEKIAQEEGVMEKDFYKKEIAQAKVEIKDINKKLQTLTPERDDLIADIKMEMEDLSESYLKAYDKYETQSAWHRFKIISLKAIFVLPLFALALWYYLRLKRRNSPYTIILTAITGALAILFLEIVLIFLYDILPMEWLKRVFKFLLEVPFLRYIIYYGSVILVILLFGGIVFYIQRRVFNPAKVAVRRLKENKCPSCAFTLSDKNNFCPKCGQQIREKCASCGNMRIHYLRHCPFCGVKE